MILATHILIAISGILIATISYFRPSKALFNTSVALVAGTVATGTYLTIQNPSHLVQSCLTGLVYVAIVMGITALARQKATSK